MENSFIEMIDKALNRDHKEAGFPIFDSFRIAKFLNEEPDLRIGAE